MDAGCLARGGDRRSGEDMKRFIFDDDLYIARVLRGMEPCYSPLDDRRLIESHLKIIKIYKSICMDNIDQFKTKGTPEETRLYEALQKFMETVSFEYTAEVAVCALNANIGITSRNVASLLSTRLIYTISGLYEYQIEEKSENYFNDGELITRERLDEFSKYILCFKTNKSSTVSKKMCLHHLNSHLDYQQIDLFKMNDMGEADGYSRIEETGEIVKAEEEK